MKRLLTLLAIAGLSTAMACGDDSGSDDGDNNDENQNENDAGADGAVINRGVQIENLAAQCTSDDDCMGPAGAQVECLDELPIGDSTIPGGYCTARCMSDLECGPGGSCPAAMIPSIPGLPTDLLPKQCFKTCDPDAADPCPGREDLRCSSIADAIAASGMGGDFGGFDIGAIFPAANTPFCFPEIEVSQPDGGVADAGTSALIVRGLDAGL